MKSIIDIYKPVLTETKTLPNGKVQTFYLCLIPIEKCRLLTTNPRLGRDVPVTEEEHKEFIFNEARQETENLTNSIKHIPFHDILISVSRSGEDFTTPLSGNRRLVCAREAGMTHILQYVMIDPDEDNVATILYHPETHPTKVFHDNWAIDRNIYNALKIAKTEEERPALIQSLQKRFGVPKSRIINAEKQQLLMEQVVASFGEKVEDRRSQYKTFTAFTKIHENELQNLRLNGDFARVNLLDSLAKKYIEVEHAHDDMTDTIRILSKLPPSDPLLTDVAQGKYDFNNSEDLRNLTRIARLHTVNSPDPAEDLRRVTNRVFKAALEHAKKEICADVIAELRRALCKFEQLEESLEG